MIEDRRRPGGLMPLDRALLHSFPLAQGWHSLFAKIRTHKSLPVDIIELAICRTALLCRADIPWKAYYENLRHQPGWTADRLLVTEQVLPKSQGPLTKIQWAVLGHADTMTTKVEIEEAFFEELTSADLNHRQIVELTAVVAAYNCISRFLVALQVEEKK